MYTYSVQEFDEFCDVKPPADIDHLKQIKQGELIIRDYIIDQVKSWGLLKIHIIHVLTEIAHSTATAKPSYRVRGTKHEYL